MTRLFLASLASSDVKRRWFAALTLLVLFMFALSAQLISAQTPTSRKLNIGDTATGSLNAQTFAQSYTFDGKSGDTLTITATSKTAALFLAVVLTAPDGTIASQNANLSGPAVTLQNIKLAADGPYVITVLRATGAQGAVVGDFSLNLAAAALPAGTSPAASSAVVTLAQGMSIALNWNTPDDMNLEVRDPVGGAVNFRTPSVPSGGRLNNNVNADCANTVSDNPSETISWPAGNVPSGSYEMIVYYNQACTAAQPAAPAAAASPDTAAPTLVTAATGSRQVSFTLTITINGDTLQPLQGTLNANQQYVASFLLPSDNQVTLQPGGPNLSIDLAPFTAKIGAPTALANRTSVTGTIDHVNPVDAWSLQVANSLPVTITMHASSGSLDTFLVLLGPDGSIVASNDDMNDNTRDSQIVTQTLRAGRYTILATRFALQIGGTEGNYTLTIGNGQATKTTGSAATLVPNSKTATVVPAGSLPAGSIEITLAWNTRADLRLLIRDPNGLSVFSDNRTPDNSGILDRLGNFKCLNTTTSPLTYSYWPTNLLNPGTYEVGVWMQSRCTDTQVLPEYTLTVNVKGTDVIKFTDRPDINQLHMLTTFTVDAAGNAAAGSKGIVREAFNGDISAQRNNNPPTLVYGTPVTGTIDALHPFVIYTFTAKSGDNVAISMRNTSGSLDPNLFLLNPGGTQINANDDQSAKDSNSRIEQKIPADGIYVVVASRYGIDLGGTAGNFELTIAQLNR